MTKDEAFDKLVEAVETVPKVDYDTVEHALVVAAQALNYIMDEIDNDTPLSASQIRKEAGVTQRDRQLARQAVEGTDDNPSS